MTRNHRGGRANTSSRVLALLFGVVVVLLVLTQVVRSDENTYPTTQGEKEVEWEIGRGNWERNDGVPFLSEEFALHLTEDADPLLLAEELGLKYLSCLFLFLFSLLLLLLLLFCIPYLNWVL